MSHITHCNSLLDQLCYCCWPLLLTPTSLQPSVPSPCALPLTSSSLPSPYSVLFLSLHPAYRPLALCSSSHFIQPTVPLLCALPLTSSSLPSPYSVLFLPAYRPLTLCCSSHRDRWLHLHHREVSVVAMGHRFQQLGASGKPQRNHQQDHGADLGLLRCHLPGLLHCQPGRLHDPGRIHRHSVWPLRQKGTPLCSVHTDHVEKVCGGVWSLPVDESRSPHFPSQMNKVDLISSLLLP